MKMLNISRSALRENGPQQSVFQACVRLPCFYTLQIPFNQSACYHAFINTTSGARRISLLPVVLPQGVAILDPSTQ